MANVNIYLKQQHTLLRIKIGKFLTPSEYFPLKDCGFQVASVEAVPHKGNLTPYPAPVRNKVFLWLKSKTAFKLIQKVHTKVNA